MPKINKAEFYASELARLEADHQAGKVSDAEYQMYRTRISASASGAKPNEYTQALDELDVLRQDGKISENSYQLHRAKLIAEASRPKRSLLARIALFVLIVLAILFVLRLLAVGLGG